MDIDWSACMFCLNDKREQCGDEPKHALLLGQVGQWFLMLRNHECGLCLLERSDLCDTVRDLTDHLDYHEVVLNGWLDSPR